MRNLPGGEVRKLQRKKSQRCEKEETTNRDTYNWYGGAERKIEIRALVERGTFIWALSKDAPKGGVCINGMVVYTIKHKPLRVGHPRTDAYVDGRRRGARVFA